jgi:hypothetical protein
MARNKLGIVRIHSTIDLSAIANLSSYSGGSAPVTEDAAPDVDEEWSLDPSDADSQPSWLDSRSSRAGQGADGWS